MPVDANGQELPWFTYPFISFLKDRLQPDFSVFEYGSGNSTIWFSRRVLSVVAVEHDETWFTLLREKLKPVQNVTYWHKSLHTSEYTDEIRRYQQVFDIIVIDGRERVACCKNALGALKNKGVIIWDNSERPGYQPGYDFLTGQGFKRIDFYGLGPINPYEWCTSVFYRTDNCLGL